MIHCITCKVGLPHISFHKNSANKGGLAQECKECSSERSKNHAKTPLGWLTRTYSHHKHRTKIKFNIDIQYTKDELKQWAFSHPKWKTTYLRWKDSLYEKELAPSIDRIDCTRPYSVDNIQLVTWRENNLKGAIENRTLTINKRNTSGHNGISFDKARQKYLLRRTMNKKRFTIGAYETIEEAIAVKKRWSFK